MPNKFTTKERKVLAALVASKNIADAARRLEVKHEAVRQFLKEHPNVREAWHEACAAAVEEATLTLASLAADAAEKIAEAIRTNAAPTANMLRTLELVLDRASAYMQERQLAAQIAALKQLLADRGITPDGDADAP